jgi:hypothetical protein
MEYQELFETFSKVGSPRLNELLGQTSLDPKKMTVRVAE